MIEVTAEKCTGCRLCEFVCSFVKEGYFRPERSRIRIRRWSKEAVSVPLLCFQCDCRACVRECPVGALSWDETKKVVMLDLSKCKNSTQGVRCYICRDSCPFDGCHIPLEKGIPRPPVICDLCGGDPECVKVCFTQAIQARTRS
jgi:Fe-S-cluster-containing hydrogenase component 2